MGLPLEPKALIATTLDATFPSEHSKVLVFDYYKGVIMLQHANKARFSTRTTGQPEAQSVV